MFRDRLDKMTVPPTKSPTRRYQPEEVPSLSSLYSFRQARDEIARIHVPAFHYYYCLLSF